MEYKTWGWRKKPSEKTIVANGRASVSLERIFQEDQQKDIVLGNCPSDLDERLASVICDCKAKDELIRKQARIAEQALSAQKMAESEAAYLKQELDKALQQGEAAEQRLAHLDAALKECIREIESLRGEQDERIYNDFSKVQKKLEAKLAESNKRVSNLAAENANLMKALLCKEKLIEDLDRGRAQLEAEFEILMARLESAEKENTFLKYECGVMEKELELRNEEREYSHRSAVESAKQIRKLEAECQQLRHLVRKRLQGHNSLLSMKTDVRGNDQTMTRRKRLNPTIGISPEKSNKGTSFLIDRAYDMEEENKTLREILALSDTELHSWRVKYCQMASRLAELEAQLKDLSEGENPSMQLALSGFNLTENDRPNDSESWANALLAELEQFRKGNIKTSNELVLQGNHESSVGKNASWLDEILKVILEEHRVSKRSFGELLQDIKIVVGCKDDQSRDENGISGLLTWKSANSAEMEDPTLQGTLSDILSMEEKGVKLEDASFTREKIRKHFGFERSKSEIQLGVAAQNRHNTLAQMIKIQSTLQEKLRLVTEENVALRKQLGDSSENMGSLQREVDSLRESKGVIEEQIENQRLMNEDLDTQLTVAKAKMNEILHKLSSLEVELEDKNNCCEELEATCLELQLQLETLSRKESPNFDLDQVAEKLTTEQIQNSGRQLKALASPDTTLFDKVLCPTTTVSTTTEALVPDKKYLASQHSTLRDCMLADEDHQTEGLKSQEETEEKAASDENTQMPLSIPELKVKSPEKAEILAIVQSKKQKGGFGFITKLFLRRKRSGCTKMKAATSLQRNTSALIRQKDALFVV